jgi:hypothetical protein
MNGKSNLFSFPMRKIKNFKVPIYYYEMERKLKKSKFNLENFFADDYENAFKEYVSLVISNVELSAIYSTYLYQKAKEIINSFEFQSNEKTEYITISILTAGTKIDEFISRKEEDEKKLSEIILEVYINTARNTVIDMIDEEAKKDNYSISNPFFIHSPFDVENKIVYKGDISKLLKEINADKISVGVSESKILPNFTEIFLINWVYKKAKR